MKSGLSPSYLDFGPSVADQAVSLSDDGTTIIIDFWSERVRAPSASFRHDGTTIIIDFFSFLFFSLFGPSDDDQAVSLSDDGTTIIIDFFSSSFLFFSFSLLLLSTAITVLPERVVVGFPNFAWAPKKK
jgi:hypothetical protein